MAAATPEKTQPSIADHKTSPHTSTSVHITYTHIGHIILWTCQTLKTEEAVGTGDEEETLKQVLKKRFKLSTSEDVKEELTTG